MAEEGHDCRRSPRGSLRLPSTMKKTVLLSFVLALCAACSVVKHTRTREDWPTVDANRVKRLLIVTSPFPDGQEKVGQLWSRIAKRYTNQKRDFLAKEDVALATLEGGAKAQCKEGIEGVIHLAPNLEKKGGGVEASVKAQLVRCVDGEVVWETDSAGSWDSVDPVLQSTTQQYASEIGPEVEPYVAPSFHLLKATLDTLPNPVLTEADKDERIELME